MKHTRLVVGLLALALVVSNAYWLYRVVDAGITLSYRDDSLQDHREALAQALAILPVVASLEAAPQDVIAVATEASRATRSFEKEGYLWVGQLGLRFDSNGRLEAVAPAWSAF